MKKLCVSVGLLFFFGLVIWGSVNYSTGNEASEQKERTAKGESGSGTQYQNDSISEKLSAYNLTTYFVRESLQEPATAEFPNTKEKLKHIKSLGEKRYQINSWVDSQDTYGATTRRNFMCILVMDRSGVTKEEFWIEEHGQIRNNNLKAL